MRFCKVFDMRPLIRALEQREDEIIYFEPDWLQKQLKDTQPQLNQELLPDLDL